MQQDETYLEFLKQKMLKRSWCEMLWYLCVQDLQRDIEKHSTGVASVLNLCEVLLHDCDACATETECESIQQATRGLDRRWRNICAIAMERRLKWVCLCVCISVCLFVQTHTIVLKFVISVIFYF